MSSENKEEKKEEQKDEKIVKKVDDKTLKSYMEALTKTQKKINDIHENIKNGKLFTLNKESTKEYELKNIDKPIKINTKVYYYKPNNEESIWYTTTFLVGNIKDNFEYFENWEKHRKNWDVTLSANEKKEIYIKDNISLSYINRCSKPQYGVSPRQIINLQQLTKNENCIDYLCTNTKIPDDTFKKLPKAVEAIGHMSNIKLTKLNKDEYKKYDLNDKFEWINLVSISQTSAGGWIPTRVIDFATASATMGIYDALREYAFKQMKLL